MKSNPNKSNKHTSNVRHHQQTHSLFFCVFITLYTHSATCSRERQERMKGSKAFPSIVYETHFMAMSFAYKETNKCNSRHFLMHTHTHTFAIA